MQHMKSLLPKDLPLRPLLLAAGAAVTAGGVYYFMKKKKRDDKENTAEHAHTSVTQDPVQVSEEHLSCDDGVSATHTGRAAPKEDPLAKAKTKSECEKEYDARLKKENSELMSRINILQASVQELGNLLCECNTECTEMSKLYEVEKNLRKHLEAEYEKMDEKHDIKINLLRVKLAESERKSEELMETNAVLEEEMSMLNSEVTKVQDTMLALDEELSATKLRCDELISTCEEKNGELRVLQSEYTELKEILLKKCDEPEVNRMLLSQKEELKKLFYEKEELLKVTAAEAERKYEQMMESIAQLEHEKSELMSEVNTLQGTVQQLEQELSETHNTCEKMERELERERESHDILKQQYNQATSHNERSPNGAEAEGKSEQVMLTEAKLESEKLVLMEKVKTLQKMVDGLTSLLSQTRRKCSKVVMEQAVMKGVHEFEMLKAKTRERVLKRKRRSLMVALEDSEHNNKELVERLEEAGRVTVQLETENSELSQNVDSVQDLLVNAEEAFANSRRRCEELIVECSQKEQQLLDQDSRLRSLANTIIPDLEKECEAHSSLKVQHDELKQQHEELLKERERSRETYSVLQSQYEEVLKQRDEFLMEREQRAHSNLESKDDEMKETPSHHDKSQSNPEPEEPDSEGSV